MAKEKLNWEDPQVRWTYRHTASHIMAQAIQHLWPDAKFAIGPAIDNGFGSKCINGISAKKKKSI